MAVVTHLFLARDRLVGVDVGAGLDLLPGEMGEDRPPFRVEPCTLRGEMSTFLLPESQLPVSTTR